MKKLAIIDRQEQKTREKIAGLQAILKQLDGARTEQENLQIVQKFRALKLSRDELYAFLGGGELPGALAGALGGTDTTDTNTAEPETIYSQRSKKRKKGRETTEPDTEDNGQSEHDSTTGAEHTDTPEYDTPEYDTQGYDSYGNNNSNDTDNGNYINGDTPNYESEGINHED